MNYIYEMHVTLLRMQYVLPDDYFIRTISTNMINSNPFNLTDLEMKYECSIFRSFLDENENEIQSTCVSVPSANSLQELTEKVRVWSQNLKTVNKSVRKSDNSMTLPHE